jgi:hypothetical protein
MGVRITSGMHVISLPFKRSIQGRFSPRYRVTQQSQDLLYLRGEFSRLT